MKNINIKHKLIFIDTLNTLGVAITWTGLPLFALSLTGSYIYAGILYLTGTIAGILATILSGYFIDKISSKKLISIGYSLNLFVIILLFCFISYELLFMIFPLMIFSQAIGNYTNLSLDVWYREEVEKEPNSNLAKAISKKNTFLMTCKTLGFTMGPIIFSILDANALLINALTFLVCLISSFTIKGDKQLYKEDHQKKWFSFQPFLQIVRDKKLKICFFTYILGGATGPVVLSLSVYILESQFNSSESQISLFWLVGGMGVVISNLFLSKANIFELPKISLYVSTLLFVSGGVLIMGVSVSYIYFILGFILMTLGTPLINNLLGAETFKAIDQEDKGKIMGVMVASNEIGALAFILISWGIITLVGPSNTFIMLTILSIVRTTLFYSLYLRNNLNRINNIIFKSK